MADEDKWARLVAKLISDTRHRTIKWTILQPAASETPENHLALAIVGRTTSYLAVFADKSFRLDAKQAKAAFGASQDLKLSIAAINGSPIKAVPVTSGLGDLLRAIEDQLSQVDEFLDKYLKS